MKRIGLDKAGKRLQEAQYHLSELGRIEASLNGFDNLDGLSSAFQRSWLSLLTSLNSITDILFNASKSSPQARQWFGGRQREMRADPLLAYMHQARNSDYHGLEESSALALGKGRYIRTVQHMPLWVTIQTENGPVTQGGGPGVVFDGGAFTKVGDTSRLGFILRPVLDDRNQKQHPVPGSHLGNQIRDATPLLVGKITLDFFTQLVAEAIKFAE